MATRRHLHAGAQHIWLEPAEPGGFVTVILCAGALGRVDDEKRAAEDDPVFVVRAGGSILLRADTAAVVLSLRVPVGDVIDGGERVISIREPEVTGPVFAFGSALLDAQAPAGADDAGIERMLTRIAEQLMLAGG